VHSWRKILATDAQIFLLQNTYWALVKKQQRLLQQEADAVLFTKEIQLMCGMRSISSMSGTICSMSSAIGSSRCMRSCWSSAMAFGGSTMFAMGSGFFVFKTVPVVFCGAFVP